MTANATTREMLLATGERLIAEHGLTSVSARRIAEEAGASNHSAVAYHFGTKENLVLEIIRSHSRQVDVIGDAMVNKAAGSADPLDHIACVLRPTLVHLERLRPPTYYARFVSQVLGDPTREERMLPELAGPYTGTAILALKQTMPDIPHVILRMRWRLLRLLLFRAGASFEAQLAEERGMHNTWESLGRFILDIGGGLLLAPNSLRLEEISHLDPSGALPRAYDSS